MILEIDSKTIEKGINKIISKLKYYKDYDINNIDLNNKVDVEGHLKALQTIETLEEVLDLFKISPYEYVGNTVCVIKPENTEKMDWSINIKILKVGDDYFIIDIPKEMKEVGYKYECHVDKSNILEPYEIVRLMNESNGFYNVTLKPRNECISYEKVLEFAKDGIWNSFNVSSYTK